MTAQLQQKKAWSLQRKKLLVGENEKVTAAASTWHSRAALATRKIGSLGDRGWAARQKAISKLRGARGASSLRSQRPPTAGPKKEPRTPENETIFSSIFRPQKLIFATSAPPRAKKTSSRRQKMNRLSAPDSAPENWSRFRVLICKSDCGPESGPVFWGGKWSRKRVHFLISWMVFLGPALGARRCSRVIFLRRGGSDFGGPADPWGKPWGWPGGACGVPWGEVSFWARFLALRAWFSGLLQLGFSALPPFLGAGRRAILTSPCTPVLVPFFRLSDVVFARIAATRKHLKMLGDPSRSGVTT